MADPINNLKHLEMYLDISRVPYSTAQEIIQLFKELKDYVGGIRHTKAPNFDDQEIINSIYLEYDFGEGEIHLRVYTKSHGGTPFAIAKTNPHKETDADGNEWLVFSYVWYTIRLKKA